MSLVEPISRSQHADAGWHAPRGAAIGLTGCLAFAIVATFSASVTAWTPAALIALPLVVLSAVWVSSGAATALLGLALCPEVVAAVPAGWRPDSRTAVLVTLCNEAPDALAQHLSALRSGLDRAGLRGSTQIFVLSDTFNAECVASEEEVFARFHAAGDLIYRRRTRNTGHKPGNLANWLKTHGEAFDHMVVLDADSRMTPRRIRHMIFQMERAPALGLLQAGITLVPGGTPLGRHQRISARLLSRGFGRGFAAWTGESGNYWGHNAIIRVAAFREAAELPVLSGRAPFGGALLSHDFIEAAWIRRAGWAVRLDPDTSGSAEDAPQTLAAFHARDRRWCQGNLQHLRLLAQPGLHPVSRVHLAMGILSYLVAPIWLLLIILVATDAIPVAGALPLAVVLAVLLIPKFCALTEWWRRARTLGRRMIVLRACLAELMVSSVLAPLVMFRQAGAVTAVCLGRDCGWKTRQRPWPAVPQSAVEASAGATLLIVSALVSESAALWLAPVALPLCGAPLIARALDRAA